MSLFSRIVSWFGGTTAPEVRTAPSVQTVAAPKGRAAPSISGRLTHKRIYTFGATPSGQSSTKCPLCFEPGQHVFSIAVDDAGVQHKCCFYCLHRYGGKEQVEAASKRSRYAKRVAECIEALQ